MEHHAVLDSVAWLGHSAAAEISYAPVDAAGRVELSALDDARTALVSVMWGNNEVGTLQPVGQIAAIARVRRNSHSDAVQAVGHIDVDFAASGLDMLSFTAHKLGDRTGSVHSWRVASFGWPRSCMAAVRSERCAPARWMSPP